MGISMVVSCAVKSSLALCLTAGLAQGAITFGPASTFAAAERPDGIASADFNGDGFMDLAVTTDTPDRVQIRLGNSTGGFGAASLFAMPSGSGPGAIASGDFDGDGDQDLAIVLKNSARVGIMSNNGSGFFVMGALNATGANPIAIVASDLDRDGDLDLVTADRDSSTLTVLRNNGAGVLSTSTIPAGDEPKGIDAADLNGDTFPDLVSSSSRDRTIRVAMSVGGTAFATPVAYPVGVQVRPEGIALADMNGDGRTDIVASASGSGLNQVLTLAQLAGGGFSAPVAVATGGLNPSAILAADFDLDGDKDVVVANQDSANLTILTTTGGALGAAALLASGVSPSNLAVARFNADGMVDLAVSNRDSNTVGVYLNGGTPPCRADVNFDGVVDLFDYLDFVAQFSAGTADFNADGITDFFDYLDFVSIFASGC
ncbi:MAG: VCBS repeat-containing protein [Planctomycetes bacterium]|nr:VCBS repeat-containing protein [Planctomycetota bacterium]